MSLRRVIEVVASAVLALTQVLSAPQALAAPVGNLPSSVQEAQRFRVDFAFSSDLGRILALAADPKAQPVGYPVPMTPDERVEWDRRMRIEDGLAPLLKYGAARPAEFGGIWVDQHAGGVIDVAFVGDAESHRANLESLKPPEAVIRLRSAKNTLESLDTLQTEIGKDTAFQNAVGVTVSLAYVSIQENRVVVGISDASDAIAADFGHRYGANAIRVFSGGSGETTGCSNRANCPGPPLRGGIAGSYGCSMAYYVVQDNDYRMLTAGHCANVGNAWSQNGYLAMGSMASDSFYQESDADAATIAGTNTRSRKSNWVYYSPTQYSAITRGQGTTEDTDGMTVCLSARQAEPVRCGYIRSRNARVRISGVYLNHQRIASYDWVGGDSGGATYNSGLAVAFGIQSGCLDVTGDGYCDRYWATYSHIGYAIQRLGGPSYIHVYTGG
jgi:streptogrisin C